MSVGSLQVGDDYFPPSRVEAGIHEICSALQVANDSRKSKQPLPLLIDNSIASHLTVAAVARLAFNCALIDSSLPESQIQRQLEQLGADTVFCNPVMKLEVERKLTKIKVVALEPAEDLLSVKFGHGSQAGPRQVVIFSSGSTGTPTGVVFDWQTIFDILERRYSAEPEVSQSVKALNLQPLTWTVGFFHALAINYGVSVVTLDPMSMAPRELIDKIKSSQATKLYLGANFARVFSEAIAGYEGPTSPHLTTLVIGSGKINWEEVGPYRRLLSDEAEFIHSFGATEAVGMMSTTWKFGELPVRGQVPIGQVGRHPNIYLEPTEDPRALEVWARGAIASGYIDQKKASERFITNFNGERWWKSGDIVTIEPESNYYSYAHRLDDVIKVRDHRVSLQDIEREILAIPTTKYAAVKYLEVRSKNLIVAFVEREKKSQVTPEAILENLRGILPSFSMPNYVILCAELPLSPRQKTSLPALMVLAAQHFNVSLSDIKTPKI